MIASASLPLSSCAATTGSDGDARLAGTCTLVA